MVGDVGRLLERPPVLEVGSDSGRPEGVIANDPLLGDLHCQKTVIDKVYMYTLLLMTALEFSIHNVPRRRDIMQVPKYLEILDRGVTERNGLSDADWYVLKCKLQLDPSLGVRHPEEGRARLYQFFPKLSKYRAYVCVIIEQGPNFSPYILAVIPWLEEVNFIRNPMSVDIIKRSIDLLNQEIALIKV